MNCLKCHKIKEPADFYANQRTCKVCVRQRSAEWRARNRAAADERRKQHYQENRDQIIERSTRYYYANKPKVLARIRIYQRDRRQTEAEKLKRGMRKRMAAVLRGKPCRSWKHLVGYEPRELVAHLEALFEPWMSWSNYGTHWHVDHRRPIKSFSLPEETRECWALSNLQPLERIANMRKGATWSIDDKKAPEHPNEGMPGG